MKFGFNKCLRYIFGRSAQQSRASESLDRAEANDLIARAVSDKQPFLAGRLGWLEAYFLGYREEHTQLNDNLRAKLWDTPGIFPTTESEFESFRKRYIHAVHSADLLGVMHSPYEGYVVEKYASQSETCALEDLEPYFSPQPWTASLKGKTVLVVHPFAVSIRRQYGARNQLFNDPAVLPEFDLVTLLPPQTMCGNTGGYGSWTQALDNLCDQVAGLDFDAAIVGCGSYGLPLGARIKELGRPCVHLGGATQILFGLVGKRWEANPRFASLINSHWRRPDESERPANYQKAEGGCYW